MLQRSLLYFAWNKVFFVLKQELFLLNIGLEGKHFDLELFLTANAVHMTFPPHSRVCSWVWRTDKCSSSQWLEDSAIFLLISMSLCWDAVNAAFRLTLLAGVTINRIVSPYAQAEFMIAILCQVNPESIPLVSVRFCDKHLETRLQNKLSCEANEHI